MTLFRLFRARRMPALIAGLALFIAGSNYCLLSGWAGNADMACLALPKPSAPSTAAKCHHCAGPSSDAQAGSETARPSCCPAPVVAPSAPALDRDDAVAASPLVLVVVDSSPQLMSAWHGHRALPDGRPPTRLARAPLPPRAPPLS